ncbi:MAG: four helix bundle protein [Nanoarchaeota archaeon]|nr:four helix bundle protein [Nanoarchaeota archaeon]
MQDFKDLDIWKIAFELNKRIYKVTGSFPPRETYALSQQLRRASVSISSNIAEGCGRRTNKDFISYLYNAMGSIKEVESQLLIAKDFNYFAQSTYAELEEELNKLGAKLTNYIKYIQGRPEKNV